MVKLMDVLIAATAVTYGLPVVSQDDDFAATPRAHPRLEVVRVYSPFTEPTHPPPSDRAESILVRGCSN